MSKLKINEINGSTGLVGWWPLNEGSGTTTVDRAGTATGTVVSSPSWVVGKFGNAITYASGKYVAIGAVEVLNPTNRTVSAWVKPGALSGNQDIFGMCSSNGGIFQNFYAVGSKLQLYWIPSAGNSRAYTTDNDVLANGAWAHVAVTQEGTSAPVFYVNGAAVASSLTVSTGAATRPATQNISIGRSGAYAGEYFLGIIDEVLVYNRALTASEIKAMYFSKNRKRT